MLFQEQTSSPEGDSNFTNPIDKDKTTDTPGLISFPHHIGSALIRPEDQGKIKSRALTAMRDQTRKQLEQIRRQAELLQQQAMEITRRLEISEKIYQADMSFEPFVGQTYYLYFNRTDNKYKMMMIGPEEWNNIPEHLSYVATVKLLSDYTWDILSEQKDF